MIKFIDRQVRNTFEKGLRSKEVYQEAIADGLNINNYYEQVMGATLDVPYEELISGSLFQFIRATQKRGIGQIKLEYVYKKGEMYEYNQRKYVKPALDASGNIKAEIIDNYTKETFIEFKDVIAERMEKYIQGGHLDRTFNFVEKNEYAEYFDNISRVFVDEQTKNMVVMQVQVVTDVTDVNVFTKYSPEFAIRNPEYFCKDEELNFLFDLQEKKFVEKKKFKYPLAKSEFVEFMSNAKRARHHQVDISRRTIGYQQYFIEQLSKVKNWKIQKELCEYKLDYGLVVINPLREQTNIIFEWQRRCYEFEVKNGELNALNREAQVKKNVLGRKFKDELTQWEKQHNID